MRKVVIIIDFDNYFGNDITRINAESLEFAFKELVNTSEKQFQDFSTIQIRLYGGWYRETKFTKQASTIQQLLRNVNVFPKVTPSKVINGDIELAVSLYVKPEFVWGYTHKETEGIRRIRINHECIDSMCNENRDSCPKFILYKFTDKKDRKCPVNSCENLQKNVFKGAEQKMVDTLIACDVIAVSEDVMTAGLIVISDDQDHLPSLAMATSKSVTKVPPIILGIQNEKIIDFLNNFLLPFNIKTLLLQ